MTPRAVYEALQASGDAAGATLWRGLTAQLDEPLRIAVVARDHRAAARWQPPTASVSLTWVPIALDEDRRGAADLGLQDRLLSTHAVLFLTPMTAPLGQADREALMRLAADGGPRRRCVALADEALLDHLADDPGAERQAIHGRLRALLPEGWEHATNEALGGWIASLDAALPSLRAERLEEVARALLGERRASLTSAQRALDVRIEALGAQLQAEDDALAAARRAAQRVAAHTLAIARRQTERLELDLNAFLRQLEADLPTQVHGVEDVELARRALPHWLSHVVGAWIDDRVARWRADLLTDLAELELEDALGAELLAPALQPPPISASTGWTARLGTTAAFGGAAALLLLGQWIPGVVALAGSFALSSVLRGPSDAETRARLLQGARIAVRQMGDDAARLLRDQLDQLATELARLGQDADASDDAQQRAARAELGARRQALLAERERLDALMEPLPDPEAAS